MKAEPATGQRSATSGQDRASSPCRSPEDVTARLKEATADPAPVARQLVRVFIGEDTYCPSSSSWLADCTQQFSACLTEDWNGLWAARSPVCGVGQRDAPRPSVLQRGPSTSGLNGVPASRTPYRKRRNASIALICRYSVVAV